MGYEPAAESEGFGKHYAESAQGMLTGMLTSQLTSSGVPTYLYSVMYYDSNGRVIQSKSSNHLSGGVEKEYMAYDFVGHPLKRKHVHSATGKPTQTEVYEYTYDQAGRLLTTTHRLNGASRVILVSNRYDAVGRLVSNTRNGVAALKTEYAYNVRSWMKDIAGPLFSQSLYYNDKRSSNTNEVRYNGNISGMDWIADSKNRGYDFSYDALSRLKGANYLEGGARSDKFDTSYSYDRQGNVLTLSRRGNAGTTTYNTVDNLTMNYMGNQLIRVEDTATNPSLSMSMDFKNGTSQEVEYSYDSNGNMVKDLNKGISSIEYNVLNLPQKVTFTGANNPANEYVYSASRKKLAVIHRSSTDKRTDYVDNMIYENSSLKRILVDGGYIENGIYHFFLQDYLGNNRIVAKADGAVVQTNHYYPYGMSFAESTLTSNQPYRYNGKEIDLENGLNLYDYEARQAEVATGRFTTIDPLAEKYYSVSPYVYCYNNPMRFVDTDGKQGVVPLPLPTPGPYVPFQTMQDAGRGFEALIMGTGNAIYDVGRKSAMTLELISFATYFQMTKISPEFQNQRRREREGRAQYDKNRANIANSIEANTPMPTPDGNSDPKRRLSQKELGVVLAVGILKAIEAVTSPDPTKDPYDAHLEKANKDSKEPQKNVQNSYLEKKKVYEIEKNEWHRK